MRRRRIAAGSAALLAVVGGVLTNVVTNMYPVPMSWRGWLTAAFVIVFVAAAVLAWISVETDQPVRVNERSVSKTVAVRGGAGLLTLTTRATDNSVSRRLTSSTTEEDNSSTSGDLVRIGSQFMLLDGQVIDLMCVARTSKGRRCQLPIEPGQRSGWTYLMRPGDPESLLGLYDLGYITDPGETNRWSRQHCARHHQQENVTDTAALEWRPFDAAGYVWADQERGGWTASGEPVGS